VPFCALGGLAVVSNAASYSEQVLDRFDLRRRVDEAVLSYAVGVLKPERHIYLTALSALGLTGAAPERVVFVGDGGNAAGQACMARSTSLIASTTTAKIR
jgi:FMN phosphatase YigB (HAD superfamily)